LQAANRVDAARALAAHEGTQTYQPSVHQPPHIAPAPAEPPAAASRTREASGDGGLRRFGWMVAITAAAAVFLAAAFIGLNALSDFTK
jgi:hypothetical protein